MKQDTIRDVLHIVFKYKALMIILFVGVIAAGTTATLFMTPVYEASSKILVKIGRENIYTPKSSQPVANPIIFDTAKDERINSEVEILKGRNLIEQVVKQLGPEKVYPDIGESLFMNLNPFMRSLTPFERAVYAIGESDLSVERVIKSDIIDVRYQHSDPVVAAKVVNELIKVYLHHHLAVYAQSHELGFFDDQVRYLKQKLDTSEKSAENFRRQNNIISLTEQKSLILKQISDLENELSKTSSAISENESKLAALQKSGSITRSTHNLGEETDMNPTVISTLRNKIMDLKLQEEDLLNKYPPDSGFVLNVRKEMKRAQDLLDKEERTYHNKAITSLEHTLSALRGKEVSQMAQLREYKSEMSRLNALDQKFKEITRQADIDESNYQLHVKHMEEARISSAMDTQKLANISVVEEALPPLKPVKPVIWLNLLLSGALGFIVSIGTVFLITFLSHSFHNVEDVRRHLGLTVLASIPDNNNSALR